jgi:hypothetical protein
MRACGTALNRIFQTAAQYRPQDAESMLDQSRPQCRNKASTGTLPVAREYW